MQTCITASVVILRPDGLDCLLFFSSDVAQFALALRFMFLSRRSNRGCFFLFFVFCFYFTLSIDSLQNMAST